MTLNYDGMSNEYKLGNPPTDCIQRVKFGPADNQHLLAASWDCSVRLYDVVANQLKVMYHHQAPVLDVAFQGANSCWSGGVDNQVKKFDFQSHAETVVGSHSAPIRCVEYLEEFNLVATSGWDHHLKFWDPRLSDSSTSVPVKDHLQPNKVYTMSLCGNNLIVGTAGRRVIIWDLRSMKSTQRESALKYQIRCVKAFADEQGYAVGSIEGRVAIEYMDPSPEVQKLKYAFKCHRNKDIATGLEYVYPVNDMSFHKKYNTFATGGSDGYVSMWDGANKKRLVQFHRYPTSISSLSFSHDGSSLAIACSDLHVHEESDTLRDIPPDTIFIRRVSDHEARSKV